MESDVRTDMKILIMGATSGIGLGVARTLAGAGHVVGVAGRKEPVLEALQKEYPDKVKYEVIDIESPDAPDRMNALIEAMGGMDSYFHISGIGMANDDLEIDRELKTMATNVTGFTRMIDCAFAYFRDHNGTRGHIAAVTSVAGTKGIGVMAAYSASKRFQQNYLMALEQLVTLQHLHISFSDIRPGWIRTPLLDADEHYAMLMSPDYAVPRIVDAFLRRRRVAVIDWRWNLLVGLWRLVPNALWVRLPILPGRLK